MLPNMHDYGTIQSEHRLSETGTVSGHDVQSINCIFSASELKLS